MQHIVDADTPEEADQILAKHVTRPGNWRLSDTRPGEGTQGRIRFVYTVLTTLDLIKRHGGEIVPGKDNTWFKIGGVEIASSGEKPQTSGDIDAYLNGLKPEAYAAYGTTWKAGWIRQAKDKASKDALRDFFKAYEELHSVKPGTRSVA